MVTKLTLEYDGTDFIGWARQPGLRTVQEEVERALRTVLGETSTTGEPLTLTVAGRTDRGVHAWEQVAGYAHEAVDPRRLNSLLGEDISVLAAEPAAEGFDARRTAIGRTYCYRLLTRRVAQRAGAPLRAVVAAPARSRGARRVRERAPRHARLHRLHAHRDRPRALRAKDPRRRVAPSGRGRDRGHARAVDRGGHVHAPHGAHPRGHDARGRLGAAHARPSSRTCWTDARARRRADGAPARAGAGLGRLPTWRVTGRDGRSRAGPYAGQDHAERTAHQRRRDRGRGPADDARARSLGVDGVRTSRWSPPTATARRWRARSPRAGRCGSRRRRSQTAPSGMPPTARPWTACGSPASVWSRTFIPTWSSRASTTARTWAMTSPTPARSPRRWRASCWASPRSPSPSSRVRARWTSAIDGGFGFETAAAFVARLVERIEDVPLPASTLLNVNVPAGEPERGRGDEHRQAHLRGRAQARARGGAPPALLDLRLGPRVPRRARHRSRGRRGRARSP